jgi:hypothetical protein
MQKYGPRGLQAPFGTWNYLALLHRANYDVDGFWSGRLRGRGRLSAQPKSPSSDLITFTSLPKELHVLGCDLGV